MFKRHLDAIRETMRTPACLRGRHAECPHLFGFGGGFNLSRLRPELGAGLCACDCHASCPVTDDERMVSWLASAPARTWHDLSLIHISEPTRLGMISYAVFCL